MRKRSTVLIHIFSQIHSKQRFRLNMYMYVRSLLSKTCSSGIVFGKLNQSYPCTFKNLTIFNVCSYLRHVKRFGICLPRGRPRSIINNMILFDQISHQVTHFTVIIFDQIHHNVTHCTTCLKAPIVRHA